MICRACLRSRSALTSEAFLSPRLLQTVQKQSISTSALRLPLTVTASVRASPSPFSVTPSRHQFFSTSSSSRSSAAAQHQESAPAPSQTPEKPSYLSEGESQIWDILAAEFAPTQLVVQDISGGCGSMYGIEICSEKFRGLSMLKQQRLVNAALGDLLKEWHGVQLKTRVP
ncbi:hypothetical protein VTH06DRAFT_7565 [Thermothelomyces fergusii]